MPLGGNVEIPVPGTLQRLSRQGTVSWRVSRLRRVDPRPFGLSADAARPPLTLGSESASAGLLKELAAAVTQSAIPLDSLGLIYGDVFDPAKALVEVTTYWDGRDWFTPARPGEVPASEWQRIPSSAWELGDAERRDGAIARQDWKTLGYPERIPADGPFSQENAEILVGGSPRTVPVVIYKHYSALSFTVGETIVTVVSRHPLPARPRFDPVTDLEPFFTGYARSLDELAARVDGQHR
jgi:hypothetical protein